jgi:CRP-like cAMP-binding protein
VQQTGNLILDSLPRSVRQVILANAQRAQLRANCEVFKAATPMSLVFVTAGCVSITLKMEDGSTPEVGLMSREGLLGYQLLLGAESLSSGHLMHGGGTGIIVPRQHLQMLFAEDAEFRTRILELTLAQTSAARQLTACSTVHEAEQRLARWLLSVSNSLGSTTVPVKQEVISLMLGVRRTTVSLVNTKLEREGVIRTRRGTVTVLDRHELVRRSCECSTALIDINGGLYLESSRADGVQSVSEPNPPVTSLHLIPDEMQAQR